MFDQGFSAPLHHAALERLVDLGERQHHRLGTDRRELRLKHRRGLDTEGQTRRIARLAQRRRGRELLQAVVPVGQAVDAVIGHGAQQLARGLALLETLQRLGVIEQERQIEHLQFLGVGRELRHRRRQQLHLVVEQRLHLVGVAHQRRVRIDLDLHLAGHTLLDQLLEQQRPLALGGVVRHHVGELDDDRPAFGSHHGSTQPIQGCDQRSDTRLVHPTPNGKSPKAPREHRPSG